MKCRAEGELQLLRVQEELGLGEAAGGRPMRPEEVAEKVRGRVGGDCWVTLWCLVVCSC